jgi:hypothetical protein
MGWVVLLERPAGLEPANLRLGKALLCQLSYDRVVVRLLDQMPSDMAVGEDGLEPPASCTSGRRSPPELHALDVFADLHVS